MAQYNTAIKKIIYSVHYIYNTMHMDYCERVKRVFLKKYFHVTYK